MKKVTKRILSVLMCLTMIFTIAPLSGIIPLVSAATYSGSCGDNLTWTLDTNTSVLEITGTGDMRDYYPRSSAPWFSYEDDIRSVVIGDSVRSIGDYAFYNCYRLRSVTIGDSVTSIGDYAFAVDGYDNGSNGLTSITIPDSVTSIGSSAFSYCQRLENVYITDITDWCNIDFANVSSNPLSYAKKLYLNNRLVQNLVIPDSVTSIGNYAFAWCTSLTSVTIPDSVTSIGDDAFYNCSSLTSITIGNSVTSIGDYAFSYCNNLTSITIGNSVRTIGKGAFSGNDYNGSNKLTSIKIPDSVISIGNSAFYFCKNLIDVTIGNSVTSIGDSAFSYCDSLEKVKFESTDETSIGNNVFESSYNVTIWCKENSYMHTYADSRGMTFCIFDENEKSNFEISNDVLLSYNGDAENLYVSCASKLGYGAFNSNKNLKTVELFSGVERIYNKAFANCTNLEQIIITQSVASIGNDAFEGCAKLVIWCYAGSYAESYAVSKGIPVQYIKLELAETVVEIQAEETCMLTASFNTVLTDEEDLIWTSDNPDVVTVTSDGKITAVSSGEATITATTQSGLYATCLVKVTISTGKVNKVTIGDFTVLYKDPFKLVPKVEADEGVEYEVTYTSSNPDVVTVDKDGNITTKDRGTATITVTVTDEFGNEVKDTCNVEVKLKWWQWLIWIFLWGWAWY